MRFSSRVFLLARAAPNYLHDYPRVASYSRKVRFTCRVSELVFRAVID